MILVLFFLIPLVVLAWMMGWDACVDHVRKLEAEKEVPSDEPALEVDETVIEAAKADGYRDGWSDGYDACQALFTRNHESSLPPSSTTPPPGEP